MTIKVCCFPVSGFSFPINYLPHHKFKHSPDSTPMAAFDCTQFQSCFDDWIAQQHKDLDELLSSHSSDSVTGPDNEKLKLLAEKCLNHFEDYCEKRAILAQSNAPRFISPSWCSSFENAFLWIGGCRPSLSIRLVYSVCGTELTDHFEEFLLSESERKDNLAQISAQQLQMINTLHCKTVREEERMSSRMATFQEDIAEMPMKSGGVVGELSEGVVRAMAAHYLSLAGIVTDADRLRLTTLKELMGILTPRQGVDFLVSTKKLHLSMHEWGKNTNQRFVGRKDNRDEGAVCTSAPSK